MRLRAQCGSIKGGARIPRRSIAASRYKTACTAFNLNPSMHLRLVACLIPLAIGMAGAHAMAQSNTPPPPVGAYAMLPGRRIWYLDTGGSGVPVVFLHAASGSSAVWDNQIEAVRSAGFRFIAYDRLGSGRSVLDSGSAPGSAADDLEALASFLKLGRFHLVGTAAGGIVAIDFTLSFPDRLRSLVVANSIAGVQDDEYLALSRRMRPSPQFDALPAEVRELGPAYRAANPVGTARWTELARQSRPATPLPAAQQNRIRITFAALETIHVPTLLVTGGADLYTPPPILKLFADRIRSAESLVVPDVGHSLYWEAPQMFNAAVLSFLARH